MDKMKRTPVMMLFGILITLLFLELSCATAKKDQGYHDSSVLTGQAKAADDSSVLVEKAKAAADDSKTLPAQEKAADDTSIDVKATPVEALLLGDKHKAAGVACSDCHAETPPANDVPTAVCMTCHENYQELAASYIDPHNAHQTYSNCGDCHHSHRQSENQCTGCHSFNLQTP